MRLLRILIPVVVLVVPAAAALAQFRAPGPLYRVIVNPANPAVSLDRKFVADAFLKKATRWGDLAMIRPVDLPADSAVRRAFCDEILRRSVGAVRNYWQQLVFSGRDVPPPELDSDDDVVKFVLRVPGGVGYVSAAANLQGAKVVRIR